MNADDPEANDVLREFIATVGLAQREGREVVAYARPALKRLARMAYGHDNSQAIVVTRWLASIYNGGEALPVQLDDIRRLDWSVQKDLLAVMVGIGQEGFPDTEIRSAFEEAAGGKGGADWLHWWTTGEAHKEALQRLVAFIQANRASSSARGLLEILLSIFNGSAKADLSRLNFMDDEHTRDFVLVLSGLFGRDQGMLHIEDIGKVLDDAGLVESAAAR